MHGLVAKVLQLSELEVDGEKIRCRMSKVALVYDKHFFEAVESRVHFQEIDDHTLRLFKVSVDHRYLRVDKETERERVRSDPPD